MGGFLSRVYSYNNQTRKSLAMSQSDSISDQIKSVKLIGFHYIQENQRRLMNRLTYILLEGVVDLYAGNAVVQTLLSSPLQAKQYVAESIELVMQQKVEASSTIFSARGNKQIQKRADSQQEIDELLKRNGQLQERVRELGEKVARQGKVINKISGKYNNVTDLMFEIKEKHQKQIEALQMRYEDELQAANKRNTQLKQDLIRAKTQLEMMGSFRAQEYFRREDKYQEQTIISEVKSVIQSNNTKSMRIQSFDIFNHVPQQKIMSLKSQVLFVQVIPKEVNLSLSKCSQLCIKPIQKPIYASQYAQTQLFSRRFTESTAQTQINSQLIDDLQEKCSQLSQEASLLTKINDKSRIQNQSTRAKLNERQEQYIKLAKQYNNLHEAFQTFKKDLIHQKSQKQSIIASLTQQLQTLSIQNCELEQQILEHTSKNNSQKQHILQHQENMISSCEQTDESTTPRKRQDSLPLSQVSEFNQAIELQAYIRKDTIGKYLLQLLDKNCKAEQTAIIIDQISSCLDWKSEQTERMRYYTRKQRLKQQLEQTKKKAQTALITEGGQTALITEGIDSKLYRFLTQDQ